MGSAYLPPLLVFYTTGLMPSEPHIPYIDTTFLVVFIQRDDTVS